MIDPVSRQPSRAHWNALIARIGASVAPAELLLVSEYDARKPWRLRIDIPDRPGALAVLVRALSTLHASVVGTALLASGDGIRTIDLAVTLPENVTAQTLLAAAMAAGSNVHVTEGSVDDGLDMPTRVLDGATELVTNTGSAPLAVCALVEADRFEVTYATEGEDDAAGVLRLQWTPDQHVVLHRDWAPFARAEQTRASALLRLAAAIASIEGNAEALGWVEPVKGGTVWIRLGRPEDADAAAAMHERCSEQTRYRRYLTGVGQWRDLSPRRLTGGHRGATLVVMSEDGSIVALGNVFPDPGDAHAAELAEIVEDRLPGPWHRHPAAQAHAGAGPATWLPQRARHRAGRERGHAGGARGDRAGLDPPARRARAHHAGSVTRGGVRLTVPGPPVGLGTVTSYQTVPAGVPARHRHARIRTTKRSRTLRGRLLCGSSRRTMCTVGRAASAWPLRAAVGRRNWNVGVQELQLVGHCLLAPLTDVDVEMAKGNRRIYACGARPIWRSGELGPPGSSFCSR